MLGSSVLSVCLGAMAIAVELPCRRLLTRDIFDASSSQRFGEPLEVAQTTANAIASKAFTIAAEVAALQREAERLTGLLDTMAAKNGEHALGHKMVGVRLAMLEHSMNQSIPNYACRGQMPEPETEQIGLHSWQQGAESGALSLQTSVPTARPTLRRETATDFLKLEMFIGVVLAVNMFTLGLQTVIDWSGWPYVDMLFTAAYVWELRCKLAHYGFYKYFLATPPPGSHDRFWHWFEALLSLAAVIDTALIFGGTTDAQEEDESAPLQVLRLTRLSRLLRIARIMELDMFYDVIVVIERLMTGVRSLKGSMMMIVITVWCCAIILTILVGQAEVAWSQEFHFEDELEKRLLFSNVFRSSLTVFRCINSDCTTSTGVSVVMWLAESLGPIFAVIWSLFTVLVNYGMLNLILTLFVENTVEARMSF